MSQPGRQHRLHNSADKEAANQQLDRAFALLGLVSGRSLICPQCGTAKTKKVSFFVGKNGTPRWGCRRCGTTGTAIDLYIDKTGCTFLQALDALLGRAEQSVKVPTPTAAVHIAPSFEAVHDVDVYDAVVRMGSLGAAKEYWATWHISPHAVSELGSTVITNPDAFERVITKRFGIERLRACGVVTEARNEKDYFLVNRRYPVIEPQRGADGRVSAMQFRPSPEQRELVEAHKRFKREHGEDAVGGPRYQTPFLSPRGAQASTLIGYGLHRAAKLPPNSPIYVVEGAKDWLAARTLNPGREFYAVPGTGVMPPPAALEVLKDLRVIVVLDGDEAGAKGREVLVKHLRDNGIQAAPVADPLPDGMDVADLLVSKYAASGCTCRVCVEFRAHRTTSLAR